VSNAGGSVAPIEFSKPQVNFYVGTIDRSLRFYRDVLGFKETIRVPDGEGPSQVELALGSFTLGLATYEALKRHHGIAAGRGPARFELGLRSDDVDGAYGWATSQGAPTLHTPYDFLGYVHAATVADPEGNPVTFYDRLPVKTRANPALRPTFRNHLHNIYTDEIGASLRFYRDLLGSAETFRVPKEGPPTHVELELGPLNLAVSTLDALRRDHGLSAGGGPPRGELVLWVSDVGDAVSWMNANGVPTLSPAHDFAGHLRGAWVADPDGNPVQLVAHSGSTRPK